MSGAGGRQPKKEEKADADPKNEGKTFFWIIYVEL